MNLLIAGSRNFNDFNLLEKEVDNFIKNKNISKILSGSAKGADSLGELYAYKHNIEIENFLPNWKLYGKKAGILRNLEMVKNADMVICFWDSHSKGTLSTITASKSKGIPLKVIEYLKINK